jgi:hypothetical protein
VLRIRDVNPGSLENFVVAINFSKLKIILFLTGTEKATEKELRIS